MNKVFDSQEEKFFYDWLLELQEIGLIEFINYNPQSYSLCFEAVVKTEINTLVRGVIKPKQISRKIIKSKSYTPDFIIQFKDGLCFDSRLERQNKPVIDLIISLDGLCYVDVKGAFTRNLTSSITFPDRQAMMYFNHSIYINKVIPYSKKNCLFKDTFYPKTFINDNIYKVGIKKGQSKIIGDFKTISQFINL